MKIFKTMKRKKIVFNSILLSIWVVYFFLLSLNFFDIISISWFWVLSPLWIIPSIVVLMCISAILLTIIF